MAVLFAGEDEDELDAELSDRSVVSAAVASEALASADVFLDPGGASDPNPGVIFFELMPHCSTSHTLRTARFC